MVSAGAQVARQILAAAAPDWRAWEQLAPHLIPAAVAGLSAWAAQPQTHVAAGDRALARGDYELAVECFYRAVQRDGGNLDALQGLAVALVAGERYEEAIPVYRMILGLSPDQTGADPAQPGPTAKFNLAVALSRLKRFYEAIGTYRELVADHEDHVQGWYNLAGLYQSQGRLAEARDAWQQVVRRNPRLSTAQTQLGEVWMDLSSPAEAMKAYAEAAKLQPDDSTAWLNLATAAQAAGSLGRAAHALKQALKLAPKDAAAWARLGEVLLEIHRASSDRAFLTEAVEAWRESLRLDGDQKRIRELLATYEKATASQPASNRSP